MTTKQRITVAGIIGACSVLIFLGGCARRHPGFNPQNHSRQYQGGRMPRGNRSGNTQGRSGNRQGRSGNRQGPNGPQGPNQSGNQNQMQSPNGSGTTTGTGNQ